MQVACLERYRKQKWESESGKTDNREYINQKVMTVGNAFQAPGESETQVQNSLSQNWHT